MSISFLYYPSKFKAIKWRKRSGISKSLNLFRAKQKVIKLVGDYAGRGEGGWMGELSPHCRHKSLFPYESEIRFRVEHAILATHLSRDWLFPPPHLIVSYDTPTFAC